MGVEITVQPRWVEATCHGWWYKVARSTPYTFWADYRLALKGLLNMMYGAYQRCQP